MTKKIPTLGLLVLTIVFSGCTSKPNSPVVQVTPPSQTVAEQTSQPQQSQVVVKEEEKPKIGEKKIAEEASVGGMTFKVNSYKETQTLTAKYSNPVAAPEGTKFILVDLTLTNEGSSDATFFPDNNFRLVDAEKKREYTTDGDNLTNVDNYLAVRKLGPGIPEKGVLVFKVPQNVNAYALAAVDDPSNEATKGYFVFLRTGGTQEATK